jgi:hypothetical protein
MMRYFLFWLQAFASSIKNPLLCRLLTSAQSPHALLHEALPPEGSRKAGQISPGKRMILPCTTAAFTIPQRSGWASSCCADSPWGSAFICSFCPSARRFALGLLSDVRSPLRPCRRLVLFKWSMIMTTLQTMYRGLAPHKIMPMPGTHKKIMSLTTFVRTRLRAPHI